METNNKLREALVSIKAGILKRRSENVWYITDSDILEKIDAALAEPVKNCDVGTADDWLARFNVVCERCSGCDCDHRLFKNEEECDCFARWLQMPYEGGGVE